MKKRMFGILLVLALCCLLVVGVIPRTEGAAIYFMSVNDTLLPLESATMPMYSKGLIYIPYSMLNPTLSGVNMGVYAIYSGAKNQALVYSNGNMLVFDLNGNTTYDGVSGAIAFDDIGDAVRDACYIKTANTAEGVWDFVAVQTVA